MGDQSTLPSEPSDDDWFPVLRPGDCVDHYQIIERIGAGGFSIVYKAKDLRNPGLYVALKGFHGTYHGIRFDKECSIVSRLKHRNIIQLFGGGTYLGRRYLVFEYLEGETLHAMLRGRPMSWRNAVGYTKSIVAALEYAYAHHERFMHGDIHPNNVIVERDDSLKVLDFGLARSLRQSEQTHVPSSSYQQEIGLDSLQAAHLLSNAAGAPGFAAPELQSDQRSDIFSVGMVMYYLLSGGLLPIVKNAARLTGRYLQEIHAVPPSADNIASLPAPGAVRRVIARATDPDPERRFQTPAELMRALQRAERWGRCLPSRRAATWFSMIAGLIATVSVLYVSLKRVETSVGNLRQTIEQINQGAAAEVGVVSEQCTSELHKIDERLRELEQRSQRTDYSAYW